MDDGAIKILVETIGMVGIGAMLWKISSTLSGLRHDINGISDWLSKVEHKLEETATRSGEFHLDITQRIVQLEADRRRLSDRVRSLHRDS